MLDHQFWGQLSAAFEATANHFNLTADERLAAWESARTEPARAMVCYSAIVRTLGATPIKRRKRRGVS